jgi:parallel beta-helix repeat protein
MTRSESGFFGLLPRILVLSFCAFILLPGVQDTRAAQICVSPAGNGDCFSSIQEAVGAASPGDVILLKKGTYRQVVTIDKPGITLLGAGDDPDKVVIDGHPPENMDIIVTVTADDVTLRNLTVKNGNTYGVVITADNVTLKAVKVLASGDVCVDSSGAGTRIVDSTIKGCCSECAKVYGDTALIKRTKITNCAAGCLKASGDGVEVVRNTLEMCQDGPGISVTGAGPSVKNNKVSIAGEDCIRTDGANSLVHRNEIEACGGAGVSVAGLNPVVTKNTVGYTQSDGFIVNCTDCTGGSVEKNQASFNPGLGAAFWLLSDGPGLAVKGNSAGFYQYGGFWLEGTGFTVMDNSATQNGGDELSPGFYFGGGSGHVVANNSSTRNHGSGFSLSGGMSDSRFEGNTARGNMDKGIAVATSTDILILDNKTKGNFRTGIHIGFTASGTVVSGNLAKGNREDLCDQGTGTTLSSNIFETMCTP